LLWRPQEIIRRLRQPVPAEPAPKEPPIAAPTLESALNAPGPLPAYPALSYATVRDFCDSADRFRSLATFQSDLKDAQRPWTVKAILGSVKPPSRILEIGSGEPLAASLLATLGYSVHACDPFDGSGRGPTEFETIQAVYPNIQYIRSYFDAAVAATFARKPLDVIFSISVLEHVKPDAILAGVFAATAAALRPGGFSIHCADVVLEGKSDAWHIAQLKRIVAHQRQIASNLPIDTSPTTTVPPAINDAVDQLISQARADLETFYLSPQGHNLWRSQTHYEDFPFRKVISVQSISQKPE